MTNRPAAIDPKRSLAGEDTSVSVRKRLPRKHSSLLEGLARPIVELDIAMKFAARHRANHAWPHGTLLVDGMLFQRRRVATIAYDRRLKARGSGGMAGHPMQGRRGLAIGLPARQR